MKMTDTCRQCFSDKNLRKQKKEIVNFHLVNFTVHFNTLYRGKQSSSKNKLIRVRKATQGKNIHELKLFAS